MISDTQMPKKYREIIEDQESIFESGPSISDCPKIPDTKDIPIEDPTKWLMIDDVICVFVDMKGSTQFSASRQNKTTAKAYQLFTGTAVRLFDEFESPYIDVRGDGVLALFDSNQPNRVLAAAVTFKTFAHVVFENKFKKDGVPTAGAHIGIDKRTLLVRKIGLKKRDGRSDRQNEVWAGRPVNMAAKLAARAEMDELWVSDRFFELLESDLVLKSCGCCNGDEEGEKADLWQEVDLTSEQLFDFDKAYVLRSHWCPVHGEEYCNNILKLDVE